MKRQSLNQFHRDVETRQRNIVFPDTARNEAGMWRNLMTSKAPLRISQLVGILIMYLSLGLLWVKLALMQLHATPGRGLIRILAAFGGWFIYLGLFGAAFLLLR